MSTSNVSKIAIGTVQFGMLYGIANKNGQVKKNEIFRILDFAYNNGINTIDTAKMYGSSEQRVGYYLKNNTRQNWSIITKVNGKVNSLKNQINDSICKLNTTPEVVLAHSVADYLNPVFCNELHQLKDTKSIKKVGVSLYTIDEAHKVLSSLRPDVIQCPLNILDTRLCRNGILDEIKTREIEIHIRSVFLQGLFFLSEDKLKQHFPDVVTTINRLKMLSLDMGLTLAELSLLWVCSLEQVDKVIIGVDNVTQLKAHQKTLKKKVGPAVFEKALSIEYENDKILNPSLWPAKL